MKRCGTCKEVLPPSAFNRCAARGDGLQNRCRSCQLEANRLSRQHHPDTYRAKGVRQYQKESQQGRRPSKNVTREQKRAHDAVARALAREQIARPATCSRCGDCRRLHAHHRDYGKPLDVNWLCAPCHAAVHREEAAA